MRLSKFAEVIVGVLVAAGIQKENVQAKDWVGKPSPKHLA